MKNTKTLKLILHSMNLLSFVASSRNAHKCKTQDSLICLWHQWWINVYCGMVLLRLWVTLQIPRSQQLLLHTAIYGHNQDFRLGRGPSHSVALFLEMKHWHEIQSVLEKNDVERFSSTDKQCYEQTNVVSFSVFQQN